MRRFEYKDARSYKFWEINVEGSSFTVRYGKVGTDGVTQTKSYPSDEKAAAEAEKKIRQKTSKGYAEVAVTSAAKPAGSERRDANDWAVLADELQGKGDPWGERIVLFQAWDAAKGSGKRKFKKQLDELDAAHQAHFYGDALPALMAEKEFSKVARLKWEAGYVVEARVAAPSYDHDGPKPDAVLEALLEAPVSRYLRRLTLGLPSFEDPYFRLESLAKTDRSALEYLFVGDFSYPQDTEISWTSIGDLGRVLQAAPNLQTLRLRGGEVAITNFEHGALTRLEIETGGLPRECAEQIATAKAPKLAHLEVWFGREDYRGTTDVSALDALWSSKTLPALKHLGLKNSEMQDEIAAALASSEILDQLASVDLSMGTMREPGAQAIITAAKRFKHLKSLDLSENYVPWEQVSALHKALGEMVNLGRQRTPDQYDDEYYYYSVVGE
ncbi:WGR domain-containing protein [Pseudenhygromyxa sp. WMMC2535]|uniref:WGR domain-containing protein n=1 Tax=Pseudenhygromyxa sp. WMMC2535 TaxID=2712867 RepID=UPI0015567D3C|nr:WGR domain-containing protein [Pseudenhygromyxa sp. WMMC2535]NVB42435.1 WGR domain-containing protein [Pseudenhygromyxa sp. WMMC2535]